MAKIKKRTPRDGTTGYTVEQRLAGDRTGRTG
jgi:hypothetical protein